jgi:hypothetical protein
MSIPGQQIKLYMQLVRADAVTKGRSKGGWGAPAPLQLLQQWRYGEGEGEEEVEERRKIKRKRGRRRDQPPESQESSVIGA